MYDTAGALRKGLPASLLYRLFRMQAYSLQVYQCILVIVIARIKCALDSNIYCIYIRQKERKKERQKDRNNEKMKE